MEIGKFITNFFEIKWWRAKGARNLVLIKLRREIVSELHWERNSFEIGLPRLCATVVVVDVGNVVVIRLSLWRRYWY